MGMKRRIQCEQTWSGLLPKADPVVHRELASCAASRVAQAAHGWALAVKLGGLNVPTQDVLGASGSAKNDTTTAWAHGDAGETEWPMPGMLMTVALARRAAAALAPARDVRVSKLPEMRSVALGRSL